MDEWYSKVAFVTGASSGIGKSIAEELVKEGFRVYGSSRNTLFPQRNPQKKNGGFLEMIPLDVCDDESVRKAVDYIKEKEGRIDVLINNAGIGIAGAVEDTAISEARQQFETNFFGVIRMCRQVLPVMREQKKGFIINIGSVAGIFSIPFQSMYSSSKFALEAFTEALRIEVKPFGIHVSLVEPGDTRTGFTDSRQFTVAAKAGLVYGERFKKSVNKMIKDEQKGADPRDVALVVLKLLRKKHPPVRAVVGFSYQLMVFAKRLLPSRWVEKILSSMY